MDKKYSEVMATPEKATLSAPKDLTPTAFKSDKCDTPDMTPIKDIFTDQDPSSAFKNLEIKNEQDYERMDSGEKLPLPKSRSNTSMGVIRKLSYNENMHKEENKHAYEDDDSSQNNSDDIVE
jgi:hypothetical protein